MTQWRPGGSRRTLLRALCGATLAFAVPFAPRVAVASGSSAYRRRKLRGKQNSPTSLREAAAGRRLVVVVLKSTTCQVCLAQLERLSSERKRLSSLGTRVVGLTTESWEAARRVATRKAVSAPVLSDPTQEVTRSLGLWRADLGHPLPAILVYDRCGVARARLRGRRPNQRPEPELFEVLNSLQRHPEECGQAKA